MKRRIVSGMLVLSMAFGVGVGLSSADNGINVERISGGSRYETSVLASKKSLTSSEYAVIASGANFPDALVGGTLAGALKAPLLISDKNNTGEQLQGELIRLGVKKVYLLGGESSISTNVETRLKQSYEVERLAGSSRFETARKISEKVNEINQSQKNYVANGLSFADALAATPLVVKNKGQLSIVDGKTPVVGNETIIGGANSVPGSETRISGTNRYQTAVEIAKQYGVGNTVIVVDGGNYPDALSASTVAVSKNAPILLTSSKKLAQETKAYLENNKEIKNVIIVGGENSVSPTVIKEIKGEVLPVPTPTPEPIPTPAPTPSPSTPKYYDGLKVSPYKDRLIKGNISSSGEKIYHMPGQRDYAKTEIDESKGERWFKTAADARAAGWRAALR